MPPTLTIGIPNWGGWVGDDFRRLVDVARAVENAGADRIAINDHVVMGPSTDAYAWGRFPTAPDAPWLEPLTVLAAIAPATSTVRLSTNILIAGLRPAALLAKTIATLDVLSGGRVDLGVGVGWQREEYAAVGADFDNRGQLLTDTVAACRALWTQLPASFASPNISFADVFCSPQPLQRPLPVWVSGSLTDRVFTRVVDVGTGWIPIMGATIDDIRSGAARLAATGRTFDIQAPVRMVRREDKTFDVIGSLASVPELVAAGATDIYVNLPSFCPDVADAGDVAEQIVRAFGSATP